jgi:hypothetical protein
MPAWPTGQVPHVQTRLEHHTILTDDSSTLPEPALALASDGEAETGPKKL